MTVALADQIAEVAREIALRANVYKARIARQQMTQQEATLHMERIEAVLATLKWLQANEEKIKAKVGEAGST